MSSKMKSLACVVAQQQFKLKIEKYSAYSEALEKLLEFEFAKVMTNELIANLKSVARDEIESEPSDELLALRDDFPTILRGSLFVYVASAFQNAAYRFITECYEIPTRVVNEKESPLLGKGGNLSQVADVLVYNKICAKNDFVIGRLKQYKHIRDSFAHVEGSVTNELYSPESVHNAAKELPGVIVHKLAHEDEPNKKLRSLGRFELTQHFMPEAAEFFRNAFAVLSKTPK